ncbi:hypothetical protein E0198_003323 [Clavispora lusitaniae]|nr:hypothetical protein E0198_003323 [Clavispora lusitaniae]
MELLSYTSNNLADYSGRVRELSFPAALKVFPEAENFLLMLPESNQNQIQGGEYYPSEVESFSTPNRSITNQEFERSTTTALAHSHPIPIGTKQEFSGLSDIDQSESIHCHTMSNDVSTASFSPLQEISHQSSTVPSPLQLKKGSYQYNLEPRLQDVVQKDPAHNVSELSFQPTGYSQSLQRSQQSSDDSHLEMPSIYQYESSYGVQQYPDVTTMVNSNSNIVAPMVETTFIDHKVCSICGRRITRDMTRHMRTHQLVKRFVCKFPKDSCRHRSGQFNRRYDFKKHLLNNHFVFDDQKVKKVHNLKGKLNDWGTCHCGQRFVSSDWLDNHILTKDPTLKCPIMYE